jgi:riboflavin kinase/FMN adenylyltransferase
MQVHYDINQLPQFKNAVITIGTFDGVHNGHQKIIDALLEESMRINGESIIITFHPHPRKIVQPLSSLQLINTLDEKISLLAAKGIQHLVVMPFTEAFSELSAEEYIEHFLIANFHPHSIIIGYDHHFGKGRKGNLSLLEKQQTKWNYHLVEIPKHVLNEISISSTKIRNAITESNVAIANNLLGYCFFFEGKVVEGDKIGRSLGFPTANLVYTDADKIHLGQGVYAVYVVVKNIRKKGMLSIGKRPTLNDIKEKVEVNIFDFNEEIYGSIIKVSVISFLRKQEKYDSLEKLKNQIESDKENALNAIGRY